MEARIQCCSGVVEDEQDDAVRDSLVALYKSCREGYDGTWDCTTDEGREGFKAMADDVARMADELGYSRFRERADDSPGML